MKIGPLAAIFFLTIQSSLAASTPDLISVRGNCDRKVVPDRASLTFIAETIHKNQKTAFDKTTKLITELEKRLKKLSLKNATLKTTGYQVHPVREYEKERMVDKGIRVALSLRLETSEIQRLGESFAAAGDLGLTQVGDLQTFLSLEKNQSEYLSCLEEATQDAEKKARRLAKALKLSLGDVHRIVESQMPASEPLPLHSPMMKSLGSEAGAPAVHAGELDFKASVDVHYKIK